MEVAVLPIKSSTVGLQTTAGGAPPLADFFKEFDFPKVGGRAEDEIGVNAVLTARGAQVFYALLKKTDGGDKLKFDYCYVIQGFGPHMNATVSVDLRRVYDDFAAHASGHGLWHALDIRGAVETLKDEKAIQVTMNGGDAKEEEVLDQVANTIAARLFTPELSLTPLPAASQNRLFNLDASAVHKEELKTETWNWVRHDLEDREFCTAVDFRDLNGFGDKLVVRADP
jgi:hypothetical protein